MTDSVVLTKGDTVNLTKKASGLVSVFAAAGWDVKPNGPSMDLDLAAFALDANNTTGGHADNFIYFGHLATKDGSLIHTGDNLTGKGDGDDEVISIDLSKVNAAIQKIVLVAVIYDAKSKKQSLKDLDNAFIRIVNQADKAELCKYTITDTDNTHDTFVLGELVRNGAEWEFKAIGTTLSGELNALVNQYGLKAAA